MVYVVIAMIVAGQNSYNCSEDSCNNPATDTYFSSEIIYNLCSEEAVFMVDRDSSGKFIKGHTVWNKGKHLSEEHIRKVSEAHKGKHLSPATEFKNGHKPSGESCIKMSKSHIGIQAGERHPQWKGGYKLWNARLNAKKRSRGFVLISTKNPYQEPIEYHHIHPDLPYVIPCPSRIHKMFKDKNGTHFQNVNAMLGIIRFEFEGIQHDSESRY